MANHEDIWDELESYDDRRATRVLLPHEVKIIGGPDGDVSCLDDTLMPEPAQEEVYEQLKGLTTDQVHELLHKLELKDSDQIDEDEYKVEPPQEEKVQGKKKKTANPNLKKVVKATAKNSKQEPKEDHNLKEEITSSNPIQQLEETKSKKGKKVRPDNLGEISDINDLPKEETIVRGKQNKSTRSNKPKQNEVKEPPTEIQSNKDVDKKETKNSESSSENSSKTDDNLKINSKKMKAAANANIQDKTVESKKTIDIKEQDKKDKSKKQTKVSNNSNSKENEVTSTEAVSDFTVERATKPAKGKPKNTVGVLKEINNPEGNLTEEEVKTGRPKRNLKKKAQAEVEIEPNTKSIASKSKKKPPKTEAEPSTETLLNDPKVKSKAKPQRKVDDKGVNEQEIVKKKGTRNK